MLIALEAVMLLLIISTSLAAATASGASVSSGPPSFGLSDWIRRAKFGRSTDGPAVSPTSQSSTLVTEEEASPSVWVYQGALYDLLNGQHIANVHGVELIRPLAQYDASTFSDKIQLRQKDAFLARCRDLQVGKMMQEYWNCDMNRSHNQEQDAVDVTTSWSRKLFCYQAPESGDDTATTATGSTLPSSHLLNSIRLRPAAPRRNVPPSQAMASYDTIVSYISPSSQNHRNNTEESQVLLHTEFPNRQTVHGLAHAKQSQPNVLDLNIFTRPMAAANQRRQQTLQLQSLLFSKTSSTTNSNNNSTSSATTSSAPPRIKRSSLVQFGMSPQTALNRYGARESYSFQVRQSPKRNRQGETSSSGWFRNRFATSSKMTTSDAANESPTTTTATVRYTRQGEGPPWYGPNRLCTLELHGQRLDNASELEAFFGKQHQQLPDNIPAICQLWAQRALNDWKNRQIMVEHDIEQFYNTSRREAVVGHLLQSRRSPMSTSDEHRWQRAVHQAQVLWQRFSSSVSTHTLHRRQSDNDV